MVVQKHGALGRDGGGALGDVGAQGCFRFTAEGHEPLFASLAKHPQRTIGKIEIVDFEPAQFRDTQAAAVKRFKDGQIAGIEGYVESIATGLMAGRHAVGLAESGVQPAAPPRATALGSLCHYISGADPAHYQPANITFDLLPALDEEARARFKRDKQARHTEVCRRAVVAMDEYIGHV